MSSLQRQLEILESHLSRNYEEVFALLNVGVKLTSWRSPQLREWFGWRNGQSRDEKVTLLWLYQFVSYSDAVQSLKILRFQLITHPLNGLIILFLSPRLLYSIPILVDHGGNGFYFDYIRNTIFYREHAERDRSFANWEQFLLFLNDLLKIPPRGQQATFTRMYELLIDYTR